MNTYKNSQAVTFAVNSMPQFRNAAELCCMPVMLDALSLAGLRPQSEEEMPPGLTLFVRSYLMRDFFLLIHAMTEKSERVSNVATRTVAVQMAEDTVLYISYRVTLCRPASNSWRAAIRCEWSASQETPRWMTEEAN